MFHWGSWQQIWREQEISEIRYFTASLTLLVVFKTILNSRICLLCGARLNKEGKATQVLSSTPQPPPLKVFFSNTKTGSTATENIRAYGRCVSCVLWVCERSLEWEDKKIARDRAPSETSGDATVDQTRPPRHRRLKNTSRRVGLRRRHSAHLRRRSLMRIFKRAGGFFAFCQLGVRVIGWTTLLVWQ